MNIDLEQSGHIGILTIDGALTSEHHAELKVQLMKAFHNFDLIVLNLNKVRGIDMTCNRLLCSAYRKSLRLKKPLKIIGIAPEEFNCGAGDLNYLKI